MSESTTRPPVYRINNDLSAAIVDREIAVLQGMPDLSEELDIDPTKMTAPEIAEIIRFNTRNVVRHQEWLQLLRRVLPEEVDYKIRLLRDLHQRRLDENITIITALQLQPGTAN